MESAAIPTPKIPAQGVQNEGSLTAIASDPWTLPPLIESVEQAARASAMIERACQELDIAFTRSLMTGIFKAWRQELPDGQAQSILAMSEAQRADAHCLAAQCLAWILVDFFASHPGASNFSYKLADHVLAPNQFCVMINPATESVPSNSATSGACWTASLREMLEAKIEFIVRKGSDRLLRRPADHSIESLMAAMRPDVDSDAFARYEARSLAASTANPCARKAPGPRV